MTESLDLPPLPECWMLTKLEEIAEINPRFNGKEITDDVEITFLPMKCVKELTGLIDLSFTRRVSEVKKGYTPFIDDDLIYAKITPCMENGKVAIVNGLKNGMGFGSTEFHVIRLYESLPRKLFFFFLIREELRKDAQRNMTGSAGQLRVPVNYIRQIPIPFPPLPEQHRIVAKLEELFTKLDAGLVELKKVKAQLKRYRQAVLKHAFEGKLTEEWRAKHEGELEPASVLLERIKEERKKSTKGKYKELPPVDTVDLPELPEGWVWTRLNDVILENQIGVVRSSSQQNKNSQGYGYIKMNNVTMDGQVVLNNLVYVDTSEEELERYSLRMGDILFNTRNSFELVGKTGIVRFNGKKFIYNNNLMRIRTPGQISPFLLVYQMCSHEFRKRMEKVKRATTNVAALYAKDMLPLPVLLMCQAEQHRIVEEIERRFSIDDAVEKVVDQNLKQAERLRQSILKRAFEGKLVLQDPTDEPASVLLDRIKAELEKRKIEVKPKLNKTKRKRDLVQVQKQTRFNDYV